DASDGGIQSMLDDAAMAAELGLSLPQVRHLRGESPLWQWEGDDFMLFFATPEAAALPAPVGAPTPATWGQRLARRERLRQAYALREQRRRAMMPSTECYPLGDEDTGLCAAEGEED
ncbi:MAG: hypothetical protein ACI4OS_07905, partial [Akkermansia sp.]